MTSGPQQSDSGSTSSLISHLGHLLLQNAVISGAQLQEANQLALAESLSFDQALIRMRFCTESQLAQILAHITRSRLVDLNQVEPDAQYLRRVPMSYALDHCCLPVGIEENHLLLLMVDPTDLGVVNQVSSMTGATIKIAVAPRTGLIQLVHRAYSTSRSEILEALPIPADEDETFLPRQTSRPSKSVSIVSNKGGVGKTHTSINLAYQLTQMQLRTLVVDADLGNADVSNKLRLYPRKTLADYLHKRNEIEEIVMQTEFGFDVLPGKTGEVALATMKYFQRIRFMNAFARVSDLYDFVIYDLGAGLNLQIMDFALCADDFVIVTTPRDMMSAYACAKFAFYRHHELETRYAKKQEDYQVRSRFEPWLVINQVVNNTQGNLVFKTLCNTASNLANSQDQVILQGFQLVPRHLGTVPLESKGFLAAEEYHQPFSKLYPHSPIVEHYRTISRFLTDPLNRSNTSALQVIGEMESEAKDDTQDLQPS